jgi:uncharacterized membrane protein
MRGPGEIVAAVGPAKASAYGILGREKAATKMAQQLQPVKRLAYVDWMRGLACVLMFQTHCYNSWLTPDARHSSLYAWSQLGGTLPAPLFIFLAGVSSALVTEKLREKGAARAAVAKTTILRGAEIYGLGLLFRVQEFVLGYRWAPWTDLLRVDVLNILGLSIMLMGGLCWLTASRSPVGTAASRSPVEGAASLSGVKITAGPSPPKASADALSSPVSVSDAIAISRGRAILGALVAAAMVALMTPWLWTTNRLTWLPWPVESYLNGVHIFNQPQPWLFPLFPWSAFAFAGLAVGFFLFSDFARRKEGFAFAALGGAGMLACALSVLFDAAPLHLYAPAIYDYWHTSPNFFLMRCSILLVILSLTYAWCRWGLAQKGFSPIIQLGTTSLLVYWVHIEFVYGRFSILPKGQCGIRKATGGLLVIFLTMLALSVLRTRWRKRTARVLAASPATAAATVESG